MDRQLILRYIKALGKLSDQEYLAAVLKYHASPVFDGVKPASIITFNNNGRDLMNLWESYKGEVLSDGVEWYVLRKSEKLIILIIYRRNLLEALLHREDVRTYFRNFGYDELGKVEAVLDKLREKYSMGCPHEMGILLGFPLSDVMAFIEGKRAPILTTGYWIVYSDIDNALMTFRLYDIIREKAIGSIVN